MSELREILEKYAKDFISTNVGLAPIADEDLLQELQTYISNLLDSTALGEQKKSYFTKSLPAEDKPEFSHYLGMRDGYNQAVAEQHKRIKLVKEGL